MKKYCLCCNKNYTMNDKIEKKMLHDNVITFFSKKEEYKSLSNYWECDVSIKYFDEIFLYESGEHCFHGEKYRRIGNLCKNENRKKQLLDYASNFIKPSNYKTPNEAKKRGGKKGLLLTNEELKLWNSISIDVQREICAWKFEHYKEVRNDLKKSGNKILVHPALRASEDKLNDRIWEGKAIVKNGKVEILGRNLLGILWMELRSNIGSPVSRVSPVRVSPVRVSPVLGSPVSRVSPVRVSRVLGSPVKMNKFPDKEDIINLTDEEINELNNLVEKTIFVDLKKVCKKYNLSCTGLKVKELRDFLKVFIEKQKEGKFEYTIEGLKKKLLKDLKKIMEDNNIKIAKGDKKEDCIKKIVRHFKSSKSRSRSPSPKWGIKFKSPKTKERVAIKHKFKKGDKVFIPDLAEYGQVTKYDSETKLYNVFLIDDPEQEFDLPEDEIKQISPRISPRISPHKLHTEYSAETVPPLPEVEPWYIEEDEPTINEYENSIPEEEILEDTERINIEDVEGVLSELQSISVDNILENNVRIKKTIQKCLALGLM